jgi:heme-degrading monooxygenase HmoA
MFSGLPGVVGGIFKLIVTGGAPARQRPRVREERGMIARIWRGVVRAHDAPAYAAYVQRTGIEGYQRTPGNRGAWLLWQVEGDRAEFVTLSFWESRAAIEGFAGQDIEKAVFYPDDEQFLIERDLTVQHYQVAGTE